MTLVTTTSSMSGYVACFISLFVICLLLVGPISTKIGKVVGVQVSGGSRKNIWGASPSSFGRQQRLSEITIEAISGVLLKM